MKKVFSAGMCIVIAGLLQTSLFAASKNEGQKDAEATAAAEALPASENNMTVPDQGAKVPPERTQIILKGKVVDEKDTLHKISHLVLKLDTGETYLAMHAPYANTLRSKAMGKIVKVKGLVISKTSFKGYPAIYIQDILEIGK